MLIISESQTIIGDNIMENKVKDIIFKTLEELIKTIYIFLSVTILRTEFATL